MAKWWSMSLSENSIAIKKDNDYTDENGSLKQFSKEVWIASCKWQRKMRAQQDERFIQFGASMAASAQSTENPNQAQTSYASGPVDDDDDHGTDVVDVVSQMIHEGMQKQLEERDEAHEEEKEMMRQIHEQELEHQRQALGM